MRHILLSMTLGLVSCTSNTITAKESVVAPATVVSIAPDLDIDNKDLILISREVAKSSDQVFGKKKKGLCGKSSEELQQILRATQAKIDQQQITPADLEKMIFETKKCGKACAKALCKSKTFQKLDSEKEKYGSSNDGV